MKYNFHIVIILIVHLISVVQVTSGIVPNAPQSLRNNAFSLTGNILSGQMAATTGQNCQTDWLMIPCATSSGGLPTTPLMCVDRICGGAFNTEASTNSSTIISK